MKINEIAAEIHRLMCEDSRFGYSQGERWGANSETWTIDGKDYSIKVGDYDCSSSCIAAWNAALQHTPYARVLAGTTYTGNMRKRFVNSGLFEWKPISFLAHTGDLYLNEDNHVAMCQTQTPDVLSEFCISETSGIYGDRGDQTGREAYVHDYYDYPWDGILHYNGKADFYGWQKDAKGWWWKEASGSWPANEWRYIKDAWYFFNPDGYMATGWISYNGNWFYLRDDGEMVRNRWQKISGKWYYFEDDGRMLSDCFRYINGRWYAFRKNGEMVENSSQIEISADGDITML